MESISVGTQSYPWHQFFERGNSSLTERMDEALAMASEAGLSSWEPGVNKPEEVSVLARSVQAHGLAMPSLYSGGRLHEEEERGEVERLFEIGVEASKAGGRILVVNPDPIEWGKPLDKDDAALRRQALRFDRLGARLRARGIRLAFHFHEPEWRAGGREVHHMMLATDPENLGVCYDGHWLWRGCGGSQTMAEDFLKLYGSRVLSLHLRQSRGGVWHETFGEGDVDWLVLFRFLVRAGFSGPVMLEMAHQPDTAETLNMTEAHRQGALHARELWMKAQEA